MIKNSEIVIEDFEGDSLRFYWDSDSEWFIVEQDGSAILGITNEDAVELIKFFARYGVSA